MDQLFTTDTIQTEAILEKICGYLYIRHLLALEGVTPVTRQAVRAHRYTELVDLRQYGDLQARMGISNQSGPKLSRLLLEVLFVEKYCDPLRLWDWMLAQLLQRASNVEQLILRLRGPRYKKLDQFAVRNPADLDVTMNKRAFAALMGITFSQCTSLKIEFKEVYNPNSTPYRFLLPTFLGHFPALEHLDLDGECLPPLCYLAAPQKLRKLAIKCNDGQQGLKAARLRPIVINFEQLESINLTDVEDLLLGSHSSAEEQYDETQQPITRLTGVRWLESLTRYPPTRLTSVSLASLNSWDVQFLIRCAATCRSLSLGNLTGLTAGDVERLRNALPGKMLSITNLQIRNFSEPDEVRLFLDLTPSLEQLEICLETDLTTTPSRDLPCRLYALKKLIIVTHSREAAHEWAEWVRRNGSPTGLNVIII